MEGVVNYYYVDNLGVIQAISPTPITPPAGTVQVTVQPIDENMTWDFVNTVWYWGKDILKVYCDIRYFSEQATLSVVVNGESYNPISFASQSLIFTYLNSIRQLGAGTRAVIMPTLVRPVQLTNQNIKDIFTECDDKSQRLLDIYLAVVNKIESGEVQTPFAMNAAWAVLLGSYTSPREQAPDPADFAEAIADLQSGKANVSHTHVVVDITDFNSAVGGVVSSAITAQKGQANGVAPLGADSKVPSAFLPSYVDDVIEFVSLGNFPGTGESGKIYTAMDTGKIYRWSGSGYVEISASPGSTDAVPEGVTNLYFTPARAQAALVTALAGKADINHVHTIANVTGLQSALDSKSPVNHTHVINDVTGLQAALNAKQALIAVAAHINDAANDAATNAPTNLNVLTTLLGTLTGEVNATNAKQNALAQKYNDLATKFNTLMDHLEAQGLQLP